MSLQVSPPWCKALSIHKETDARLDDDVSEISSIEVFYKITGKSQRHPERSEGSLLELTMKRDSSALKNSASE